LGALKLYKLLHLHLAVDALHGRWCRFLQSLSQKPLQGSRQGILKEWSAWSLGSPETSETPLLAPSCRWISLGPHPVRHLYQFGLWSQAGPLGLHTPRCKVMHKHYPAMFHLHGQCCWGPRRGCYSSYMTRVSFPYS
jgi:hypothetical protein